MKTKKNLSKIVAVDLFCGVGGLTYGLRRAGLDVKVGFDIDENCRYPYESNNEIKFVCKSVTDVSAADLNDVWDKSEYKLLAGCAPCQPFSTYRQGSDPSTDHRWPLLSHFGRLVRETRPDFVTMENVPRLRHQLVFLDFVASLEGEGFEVSHSVVKCSEYGVPQQRQRLVLVASRHGMIKLVAPRHSKNTTSVRKAIGKLPPLIAGEVCATDPLHQASELSDLNLKRIRASKPGGTWRDWPSELVASCHGKDTGSGYSSVYGRMEWDEPSPTMTTQFYGFGNGRFGHPEQDRAISLREGAILQSFPKKYNFVEPGKPIHHKTIGRLIGNAVPVKLGEAIGKSFIRHLDEL